MSVDSFTFSLLPPSLFFISSLSLSPFSIRTRFYSDRAHDTLPNCVYSVYPLDNKREKLSVSQKWVSPFFHVLSFSFPYKNRKIPFRMREIVHIQAGQCGNQIGSKVGYEMTTINYYELIYKYEKSIIIHLTPS